MFKATLKQAQRCAFCGALIQAGAKVWFKPGCGCAYCSDECRDEAIAQGSAFLAQG